VVAPFPARGRGAVYAGFVIGMFGMVLVAVVGALSGRFGFWMLPAAAFAFGAGQAWTWRRELRSRFLHSSWMARSTWRR
jgi:hypothetical protein